VPEYGRITALQPPSAEPPSLGPYPPPPWKLPGAEVVQVTIEVDAEAALDHLPAQLSRPVPPYAKLVVARYPESPLGPFAQAALLVACRHRVRWLQCVAACLIDQPPVAAAARALWAYPCQVGRIALERAGNQVRASVAAGDRPILDLELPNIYAVDPAMIRYDVTVTLRPLADKPPEVLIVSAPPAPKEGWLAKGARVRYHDPADDNPWLRLRNLHTISSTYAVVDLEWPMPRAIDFAAPVGAVGGIP
jgi:hypothetical protein